VCVEQGDVGFRNDERSPADIDKQPTVVPHRADEALSERGLYRVADPEPVGHGAKLPFFRSATFSLLYDTNGLDRVTFACSAALMLLAAAGACAVPARRAGRLDPAGGFEGVTTVTAERLRALLQLADK
jgi:hypothetical protein